MGQAKKYHPTARNSLEPTLADLPAPNTRRWNATRKIFVVRAIELGMLSFDHASDRYSLSLEEFISWQKLAVNSGKRGVNSSVREALRVNPLWTGSDRHSRQAPLDADISESF